MQSISVLMMMNKMAMIKMTTIVLVLLVGVIVAESDDMDHLLIKLKLYLYEKKIALSREDFLEEIDRHVYEDDFPKGKTKVVLGPIYSTVRDKGYKLFPQRYMPALPLSELRKEFITVDMDDADWVYEKLLQVSWLSDSIIDDIFASTLVKQNKNPVPNGCTRGELKKRAELFKKIDGLKFIYDGTRNRNPYGLKLYMAKVLHLAALQCCDWDADKVIHKGKNDQKWLERCRDISSAGFRSVPSVRLALVRDKLAPFLTLGPEDQ